MATATWTCNKDARIADNGSNLGAGASDFNPIGPYGSYLYRTLLGFSYSFAGMVSITSAILHCRTSTQSYIAFGGDPDIEVNRLTGNWSEGSSVGLSTSNAVHWGNQPGSTGTNHGAADVPTAQSTWFTVDITALINDAKAAGVFYGLKLIAANEANTADTTEIYSREQGSSDPYIVVTYTTNVAPNAPTVPVFTPVGGGGNFSFTHSDNDGDALLDYDIQVSSDPAFGAADKWDVAAQTAGIAGNNVVVAYGGSALARGTTYYWRARTSSAAGILTEGPYTTVQSFKLNQLPTVAFVTPSAADALIEMTKAAGAATNPRMVVRWAFNDPDGGGQAKYQVVVVNDAGSAFWDSGVVSQPDQFVVVPVDAVRGDFYKVTVTVYDAANETATTGQRRCKSQWAVVEYKADAGAGLTAWSAVANSTRSDPTKQLVVTEYASSAAGGAIGTWFSSLASAALARWFHWRVFLFAWSGAVSPSFDKMALTYTSSAGVPPDGWTVDASMALDTGTKVYGTQSLRGTGNGAQHNAYQTVPVQKNTNYILSGRIKSDGNSQAILRIVNAAHTTFLVASPPVAATQDWTRVQTPVWFSGDAEAVIIRCDFSGAAGTVAWFDALKLESSTVVTSWVPGLVGAGVSVDAGGIKVDASPVGGATLRLLAASAGARDTVELGSRGLRFGSEAGVEVYSPSAGILRSEAQFQPYNGSRGAFHLSGDVGANNNVEYGNGVTNQWVKLASGSIPLQYQSQHLRGVVQSRYATTEVAVTIDSDPGMASQPNVNAVVRTLATNHVNPAYEPMGLKVIVRSLNPVVWELWFQYPSVYSQLVWFPTETMSDTGANVAINRIYQTLVATGSLPAGTQYDGVFVPMAAGAGTVFPTIKGIGTRFFRTDLLTEYAWNGTRWLCTCPHVAAMWASNTASTEPWSATPIIPNFWYGEEVDLWVERWRTPFRVSTTNNATNYWVFTLGPLAAALDSRSGAVGGLATVAAAVNAVLTAGSVASVTISKFGAPGALDYLRPGFTYRRIAT